LPSAFPVSGRAERIAGRRCGNRTEGWLNGPGGSAACVPGRLGVVAALAGCSAAVPEPAGLATTGPTTEDRVATVGDPCRDHAPQHRLEAVTEYHVPTPCAPEDAMVRWVQVLRPMSA